MRVGGELETICRNKEKIVFLRSLKKCHCNGNSGVFCEVGAEFVIIRAININFILLKF
jgi:hypothetical protein